MAKLRLQIIACKLGNKVLGLSCPQQPGSTAVCGSLPYGCPFGIWFYKYKNGFCEQWLPANEARAGVGFGAAWLMM